MSNFGNHPIVCRDNLENTKENEKKSPIAHQPGKKTHSFYAPPGQYKFKFSFKFKFSIIYEQQQQRDEM